MARSDTAADAADRLEALDEDVPEIENERLNEVLEFYDCADLLPYANHILWLSTLKDALGHIPVSFRLDWEDMRCLAILKEEINKKVSYEAMKLRESSRIKSTPAIPPQG